jgi:gluconate kinase
MEVKRDGKREKEEKVLLTFLKQTRSLLYSRVKEKREEPFYEDEYYYGVR